MIYLASASPRRQELLKQIAIDFEQFIVDVDESALADESPHEYVARVAQLKAHTANGLTENPWPILAADTIVVNDNQILGKPKDQADAVAMLQSLSGKTHQVKTAIAVMCQGQSLCQVVTTKVVFRQLSQAEIVDYWLTGEAADKAGAYGIQGIAGKFVESIEGSYSAVVGLPLLETERLLNQLSEIVK